MAVREVTKPDREHKGAARKSRKSKTRKKANARAGNKSRRSSGSGSHTSLNTLMIMAVVLLVVGIGSMVALRYMAAFI